MIAGKISYLKVQIPNMKKYLLIAGIGLLTTAGVTATVLGTSKKKTDKDAGKKECPYKKHCCRASAATASY